MDSKSRICLLGENGAGKTTLVKLMQGELEPTQGLLERASGARIETVNQHHAAQVRLAFEQRGSNSASLSHAFGSPRAMDVRTRSRGGAGRALGVAAGPGPHTAAVHEGVAHEGTPTISPTLGSATLSSSMLVSRTLCVLI